MLNSIRKQWKAGRDNGLTLIELLITVAVLAIVSAIAIPVVGNVVSASEDNSAATQQAIIADKVAQYSDNGTVAYDAATGVFSFGLDLNADGDTADAGETVETAEVDLAQYTVTANQDGSYSIAKK